MAKEVVKVTYEDGHVTYLDEATIFAENPEKLSGSIIIKKAERIEIMECVTREANNE